MSVRLEVLGVSKAFRGLRALTNVSFDVAPGSLTALIGPNGAGKTTCFNIVAGVYPSDSGRIVFNNQPIHGFLPHQVCAAGIGRTFQIVKPFAGLSVLENVIVGALARARDVPAAKKRAAGIVEKLGLGSKRDQLASTLTLPDRKRLEVARALATQPKLLLLDEVMAGLRPTETDRMVAILGELNRESGLTILLIEHVMRAVMALASRVLVLHHGAAIAEGTPDEVVRDRAVIESYLGVEALA